jgi:hypothetical protein
LVQSISRRNHVSSLLINMRGCDYRHAMTPEDVHHLHRVGRPALGSTDYFGSFTEVRWTHYRGGYDDKLFNILAAEIIETVNRTSGDTQRLPWTHLDGFVVNRPGKDSLDTIDE